MKWVLRLMLVLAIVVTINLVFAELFHINLLPRGLAVGLVPTLRPEQIEELLSTGPAWRVSTSGRVDSIGRYSFLVADLSGWKVFTFSLGRDDLILLYPGRDPDTVANAMAEEGRFSVRKKEGEKIEVRFLASGSPALKISVDRVNGSIRVEKDGLIKKKRHKFFTGDAVHALGWGALVLVGMSTLYSYYKRRRLKPGEMRILVVGGRRFSLRNILEWHGWLAMAATAFTIMHVLNFLDKIRLNVSFLTTFFFLTVALSGVIGRYVSKRNALFREWRRFHIPYTILFYVLLTIHVAQKLLD